MPERFKEEAVRARLVARMFKGRLVENRWRGDLVEEVVRAALAPDGWALCSGDWTSWDLKDERSGLKIQVKQTSRRQTWGISQTSNRYSIKPATGFYKGATWFALAKPERLSEIYVFAHHPIEDETANHWDATQWQFYVVAEAMLPPGQRSISIPDVVRLAAPIGIGSLAVAVREIASVTIPNGSADRVMPLRAEAGDVDEAVGGSV